MSNIAKLDSIKNKLEEIKTELWNLPIKDDFKLKTRMNELLDELDFVEFIKD